MSKDIFTALTVDGEPVSIIDALELRDRGIKFKCDDCGESVSAHKQGKRGAKAHFEHHQANPHCKY